MNFLEGHFSGGGWTEFWTIVGMVGAIIFGSRFYVQWYITEKKRQVVIPVIFWWLSLVGSLLVLAYAFFYDKHIVVILMNLFAWIPYTRNLIIHYRHEKAHSYCPQCESKVPPLSNFCSNCGAKLPVTAVAR